MALGWPPFARPTSCGISGMADAKQAGRPETSHACGVPRASRVLERSCRPTSNPEQQRRVAARGIESPRMMRIHRVFLGFFEVGTSVWHSSSSSSSFHSSSIPFQFQFRCRGAAGARPRSPNAGDPGDVGVLHRPLDGGVAHQRLDGGQRHATHHEVAGECVPEHVIRLLQVSTVCGFSRTRASGRYKSS